MLGVAGRKGFTLIELLVVIAIIAILAAILFPVFSQVREKARQTTCLTNTRQLALGVSMYAQDWGEVLPTLGTINECRGRWMFQIHPYVRNRQIFTCPNAPRNEWDGTMYSDTTGYGWAEHIWSKWDGSWVGSCRRTTGFSLAEIRKPAETIASGDTGFNATGWTPTQGRPGWAMYRRPPWVGDSDPRPGYYPQFRHLASQFRPFRDTQFNDTLQMPMDGLCNFVLLDGHAKAYKATVAFQQADNEDGIALTGDDRYLMWNLD
jgi:prepilin-type N-terminal cleavage/methylation domain-containing protein